MHLNSCGSKQGLPLLCIILLPCVTICFYLETNIDLYVYMPTSQEQQAVKRIREYYYFFKV